MSQIRRSMILLIVAVVVLLGGGGLLYLKMRIAADQFRQAAEQTLSKQLNLPVRIGEMSLSFLHRSLELRQITIGDLPTATQTQTERRIDAPLLTIEWARVALRWTSLLRGAPQVRSLVIHGPQLRLTDSPTSSSSLARFISGLSNISEDRETEGFPIVLEQGTLTYQSTASPRMLQIDSLQGQLLWPSPDQPVVTLATDDMMVRLGTYDLQKIRLQARARLTHNEVQVEQFSLAKAGSSLTLTGTMPMAAGRSLTDLSITGQLDPQALASQLGGTIPWKGHLTLNGTVVAKATPGTFTTSLLIKDATGHLVGQADARAQDGLLTVKRLSLAQGASRLTMDGSMDLKTMAINLSLDLRGRLEDAAQWVATDTPVGGPIVVVGRLTGTPLSLDGTGRIEMRQMRIGTEQIDALEARLTIQEGKLTIPSLTARYREIAFKASATIEDDGGYRFAILPTKVNLASIPGMTEQGSRGGVVVSLSGTGQWPERRVEGELALNDMTLYGVEIGSGRVRFALEDDQWRWELVGSRTLQTTGVAPLWLNGPIEVKVSATDLDMEPLIQALHTYLPFPLALRADGHGQFRGTLPTLRDLTGWIELTGMRGRAESTLLHMRQPARIVLQPDALRCDSLEFIGRDLAVTLMGRLGSDGLVDLSLTGHAPFGIIGPWLPVLRDLKGTPKVQLSMVGKPKALRVAGRAELSHVQVKPKIIPIWIAVEAGEVTFNNDHIRYTVTEATSAGGRLKGEGTAQRQEESWHHTLEFNLDNANLDAINDQLLPERRWVSGTLSAHTAFAFDTAPNRPTAPTLQGQLSLRLDDGSLSHYPAMVRLIGLLGAPTQPYRLPDLTRERMPYHRISADIAVKDGVMHTTNLLLNSEVMRLTAEGRMNLADQRVDLDLAVRPLHVLERGIRKIPLLGRLLSKRQSLIITHFDMEGPWDDPTISVAPVKSLRQTARDFLLFLLRTPWRAIAPTR